MLLYAVKDFSENKLHNMINNDYTVRCIVAEMAHAHIHHPACKSRSFRFQNSMILKAAPLQVECHTNKPGCEPCKDKNKANFKWIICLMVNNTKRFSRKLFYFLLRQHHQTISTLKAGLL